MGLWDLDLLPPFWSKNSNPAKSVRTHIYLRLAVFEGLLGEGLNCPNKNFEHGFVTMDYHLVLAPFGTHNFHIWLNRVITISG